jgi:hypothetical protein
MVRAYNKVAHSWIDTIDGSELTPIQDWIVDPVFVDEVLAMRTDQSLWTFDGTTISCPTQAEQDVLAVATTRQAKWELIKAERERRRQGGILVSGNWYHSDDTSRIQHIGLLLMGANMPTGIMWKTMPNSFVEMTPALAVSIFNAIGQKDMQIFAIAEQHRQQLFASPNPDTYDHLNTAPAWPQVFGE